MTESATTTAEPLSKQEQTRLRIVLSAQELCRDRGFEGFTMDELAEAAGVSRRTLFNYFPSKFDAVVGGSEFPDFTSEELAAPAAVFRAGGPYGVLARDVGVLGEAFLSAKPFHRDIVRGRREVLTCSPKLFEMVQERFAPAGEAITRLILEREGEAFGPAKARLVIALLAAVFDSAMHAYLETPEDSTVTVGDLFADHVLLAGDLLAH